jgi:hypothetical protein
MTRDIERRLRKLESRARPRTPEQLKKAHGRVAEVIKANFHAKRPLTEGVDEAFAQALGYSSVAEADKARDRRDPEYFARAEEFWNRRNARKATSGNTDESA